MPTSKPRLLVVDDDESLRRVTQVQLEGEGYLVSVAADGEQALAVLEQAHHDLVVTDLRMPRMSGVDLLRRIRPLYPDMAVILVTAFGSVESATEAMNLGAFDYMTKPVSPDVLRQTVRRALSTRIERLSGDSSRCDPL